MRRLAAAVLPLTASAALLAGPAQATTAAAAGVPYHWQNAAIIAGGFVDGLVFSRAQRGLAYARTDIGGAYRWDASTARWVPLLDFTGFNEWNELGVESIAADRANPGKVWAAVGEYTQPFALPPAGEILRSADQGRSWQISTLPIQLASNQDGRGMGERLAVDPSDDAVLYLASPANGLWRSTDGGASWAQVASFPVTSTPDDIGLSFVAFGPAGPHGQPTKTIFVGDATGKDLYESTDAGAIWRLVPGQPAGMMPQHAALASDGTLYVDYANQPGPNGMTDGSVWKYATRTGAWTDITPEVQGIFRSTDGGSSWLRINTGAQQWGWIGQTITGDPRVFGRVYLGTNGRGIRYGDPAGSR